MKLKKVWPERIVEIESPVLKDVIFKAVISTDRDMYSADVKYSIRLDATYESEGICFRGQSSAIENFDPLAKNDFKHLKSEAYNDIIVRVNDWPKTKVGYTDY